MISFTYLQCALLDAQARVYAAQLADEANTLLNHKHNYSHAYLEAYWHWQNTYYQWREVYEQVCFPLTAIGVLYDPSLELFMDKDTIKLPIVEFPTDKLAVVAA